MIWLEINGLPLCAWGSNSYKKIASLFGKFKFFEDEETSMSVGRVCISTKSIKHISVTIKVKVNGELFDVNVLEIGIWNTNITDTASNVSSQMEANHLDKDDTSVEDKENDDLDDIDGILKDLNNDAKNEENVFVSPKEVVPDQPIKSGSLFSRIEAEHFNAFIDSTCLIDLSIGGCHFTWMNKAGTKLCKLDHFLISEGVMEDIPDIKVTAIERLWSDHSPILLHSKKADFGPSPFKLYNSWLSRDGFDDIVKSTWDSMETGNDSNKISSHVKLRNLKNAIKKWQVDVRKIVISQKSANLSEIHDIEKKIDDGSASISDHEVKNAVWECGSNKAPGPDGLSFAFIKKYWDLMKMDIFEFVNSFFASGSMPQGANSSFFTLIPKMSNLLSVKDFRPISLIGTHYKIISKLLANRLSKRDHPVVQKEEKKMLIFKVDFEKDFDSVSWMYLDFILDSLGFGSKWRSWIRACLHSSRASILINGSPTSEFSIKRGLRQGDPLSPFLFILVMEGLHCAISNAVNSGLIRGIKLGSSGGRLTLIKAVLGSLGIYYIFIFKAPETILNSMESLRSRFFWGGSQDSRNMAWVKWSQRWRFLSSPNNMWVNIIKALHGQEGGLNNHSCSFNGTWSRIIGTSNFLHSKGIIPLNSFCFKVGCGTRVRFWKDIWIGDSPLHTRYNRLYRLDQDKYCLIIDRIVNGQWQWNWSRSDIGTRNMAYLNDLLLKISQIDISVDEDTCTWVLSNDGTFSVKSARRLIDSKLLLSIPTPTVWDKFLLRKVNIFLWRLSLDRLPHRLNLSSRGLDIPTISCSSCN
nr:hypothetical protein [Tanacetum cinerariifolium]